MSAVVRGMGVSPGIAVGEVVLLRKPSEPVVPVTVPPERLDEEIDRFEAAREQARHELEELRDRTREALGDSYAGILDAQLLILVDPKLVGQTIQRMRVGRVSASWALKQTVQTFLRKFDAIDDGYLRERGGDLQDVHHRLQRILRGGHGMRQELHGEGPHIVVAHALGPSDAAFLARQRIAGFATDMGGPTSHTAILAQALSVPAVVGLHDITDRVRSGEPIVIDGGRGEVVLEPTATDVAAAHDLQRQYVEREDRLAAGRDLPAATRDGVAIGVLANIEFPQEVDNALRFGAHGIGLYRSEFLFLARSPDLPTEEEHYRVYREMAEKMAPHPVTIRTLDLGGEKYFHDVLDADESNPVLGLRAVRFCLKRPDIFRPQLRGLLRAAVQDNVRMMIPLVTYGREIREIRRLIAHEAERLKSEGVACRGDVPVGIMVEVPAAAMAADLLADDAEFFSIGTNDLIQYALAVDRGNESVSYLYQPLHPAVLRMLRFVVRSARDRNIPVAMCGEVAADPLLTGMLIGLGLRDLSVQPRAIAPIRETIRGVDCARETERFEAAVGMRSTAEIDRFYRGEPDEDGEPGDG